MTKIITAFLWLIGMVVMGIIIIVIGITVGLTAIFWIRALPSDVSSDPQYSEIYHQIFEVQTPLFIHQWPDTKSLYLNIFESDIAKLEKGTKVQVKKVTQSQEFATDVRVLITIDDPPLSTYKTIDAHGLIIKGHRLGYSDDLAQFDPQYLKNIEIQTLHMAVQYEDFEAIKYLTESGIDLNQTNLNEMTPLHYAQKTDIELYLLENGANPNLTDKWGKTLFHYAAQYDIYDIVKLLITKGAFINQKDKEGNTPLLIAADANHFNIVLFLLESGADPLLKGQYQNTVLLYAAQHDQLDIAELPLKLGVDPLAVCGLSQMSGVLFAARNNNLKRAKLFLEAGASTD